MTEHSTSKREVEQEAEGRPGQLTDVRERTAEPAQLAAGPLAACRGAGETPVAPGSGGRVPLRAVETQCRGTHCGPTS